MSDAAIQKYPSPEFQALKQALVLKFNPLPQGARGKKEKVKINGCKY